MSTGDSTSTTMPARAHERARPCRPEDFPAAMGVDGRIAWVLGLIAFVPIPLVGMLATVITMIVVGLLQGRKNPVARAVGRRAATFAAVQLIPVAVGAGFLIWAAVALPSGSTTFDEHPIALSLWIGSFAWAVVLAPLLLVVMGFVALARPVSRDRAARILSPHGA